MEGLAGRGVVITGALGIYGAWIADAFGRAGAKLCLTDRTADGLDARLTEAGGAPGSFVHVADVTDDRAMAGLVAAVGERWGAADILINNAGIYPSGFLLDIDPAEWDRIMNVNVRAPFVLSQMIAKQMIAAGTRGSIVNISSGAARKMRRSVVPYCLSKTALDRLTKGFALELAGVWHPRQRRRTGLRGRQHRLAADRDTYGADHGRHPARPRLATRRRGLRRAVPLFGRSRIHHRDIHCRRWRQLDRVVGGASRQKESTLNGEADRMSIKGKAYIVGAFEHPTRKAPDKSVAQLHAEAAAGALADAGLSKDDVDGYFCAGDAPGMGPVNMADYMNLRLRHLDATDLGGCTYIAHVAHAAAAIAEGKCKVALITLAGRPRSEGHSGTAARVVAGNVPDATWEAPFGGVTTNLYAMCAARHMHQYGTTSEQLAWIKVAASHHAQYNPARHAARRW